MRCCNKPERTSISNCCQAGLYKNGAVLRESENGSMLRQGFTSPKRWVQVIAFGLMFLPRTLWAADAQDEMPSPPPKPLSTKPASENSYYAFGAVPAVNYSSD